jgi:hypothetical protein
MSIFVLTEYLYTLASDYGVLFQFMGQDATDAFSRRLTEMSYASDMNDLQKMPGCYEYAESVDQWQLWSVDLSNDSKLYFISTESIPQLVSVYSYSSKSYVSNSIVIVGIKTNKILIGHKTINSIKLEHENSEHQRKAPIAGYIFERKVG